jgi:hypothetical protein
MKPRARGSFFRGSSLVTSSLVVSAWMIAGCTSHTTEISEQPAPRSGSGDTLEPNPLEVLQALARDIEGLKGEFPQLKDFSPAQSLVTERLMISYSYHTHSARHGGGWTSGVPNPDDDGIWFYIDFHDPDSQAQIHTQPITPSLCLGRKRASFLILEGSQTKPVAGRIGSLLSKHDVKPCGPSP